MQLHDNGTSSEHDAFQRIFRFDIESCDSTVVEGQRNATVYHQASVKATGFHSKLVALLSVRATFLVLAPCSMIHFADHVYHVQIL